MVNSRNWAPPGWTRDLKPSRKPMTSMPWLMASMVTELMTPLMPGAGPPPTRRASLPGAAAVDMGEHLATGGGAGHATVSLWEAGGSTKRVGGRRRGQVGGSWPHETGRGRHVGGA